MTALIVNWIVLKSTEYSINLSNKNRYITNSSHTLIIILRE